MHVFVFFIIFFVNCIAYSIEWSKSFEAFIAQNQYNNDFEFSEKQQRYHYLNFENKFFLNNKFDVVVSPELIHLSHEKFKDENRTLVIAKDLSLNYYGAKTTIRLGSFQMKKEGPDLFDPFSYQQPKNYIDPLHITNLPLAGLKIEHELNSKLSFEGVYIPQNTIPIIPSNNSPWYPRENKFPIRSEQLEALLPNQVQYQISENRADKPRDLQHNYIFKTKLTTNSADYIFQMAETISDTPEVVPDVVNATLISTTPNLTVIELENPVSLSVRWKKMRNYGAGMIAPISKINTLVKFFANRRILNNEITDQYALALEKSVGHFIFVAEYSYQKFENLQQNNQAANILNLYENANALGVRYAPSDQFSILTGGLYDNIKGSYLYFLKPRLLLHENIYTELQIISLGGRKNSLLSNFESNDSVSLKLGAIF